MNSTVRLGRKSSGFDTSFINDDRDLDTSEDTACFQAIRTLVQLRQQVLVESSVLRQHEQEGETKKQLYCFVLHDAILSLGAQDPTCTSDGGPNQEGVEVSNGADSFFFNFSDAYGGEKKQKKQNVFAFVAQPDEVVGIVCQIPYHLQEVLGVLSNRLTKGQCPNTHMEPQQKHKKGGRNVEHLQLGQE